MNCISARACLCSRLSILIVALPFASAHAPKAPVVLSWNPRLVLYDDFLSSEEVRDWNDLSTSATKYDWRRMSLVGIDGESVPGDTVTSTVWYLPKESKLVKDVRMRIAETSMHPEETMEQLKMLRYSEGAYFRGHIDAHALAGHPTTSRVATAFIYLSGDNTLDSGATCFPLAIPTQAAENIDGVVVGPPPQACKSLQGKDPITQSKDVMATYLDGFDVLGRSPDDAVDIKDAQGLSVPPKPGRMLIWWSRRPDGQLEPRSQHAGCPPAAGRPPKFALTQWIHMIPIEDARGPPASDVRRTLDWQACPGWKGGWLKRQARTLRARRCAMHVVESAEDKKEYNTSSENKDLDLHPFLVRELL